MLENLDSELKTYFDDLKHTITKDDIDYLKTHPELKQVLNDYLKSCLLDRPENIHQHSRKFFTSFSQAKDSKKYMPCMPLVITGCSGVGKGTLINFLLNNHPDLFELSISYTTRDPRPGQADGRQYYFVTQKQFEEQKEKGIFAEQCYVHGNYYGTHKGKLKQIINKGKIGLLDIDIQGGQKIHNSFEGCHYLFIQPPTFQALEERLKKRGTQTPQSMQKRLKNAKIQLEVVKTLGYYQILINDDLEVTKKDLINHINKIYGISLQ